MFVYLAPLKDQSAFKIGRSQHPDTRLTRLGLDFEFDLGETLIVDCGSIRGSIRFERMLHEAVALHRLRLPAPGGTEFFSCEAFEGTKRIVGELSSLGDFTVRTYRPKSKEEIEEGLMLLVAETIRARRLELNIKQSELAVECGVHHSTIKRIEGGQSFSVPTLYRVCAVLGLDFIVCPSDAHIPSRARASRTRAS